jgi:hypothetical protein
MRNILILAFSNLKHDARVLRQIEFLKDRYSLTVVCFDAFESNHYHFIKITKSNLTLIRKVSSALFLLSRLYSWAYRLLNDYRSVKDKLINKKFDLVIANDIESLPLAFEFGGAKVLFDAHEYAPRHFEDKLSWRIFFQGYNKFLCKKFIPRVNAMTTVGDGLAKEYARHYAIKPIVVTNASHYFDVPVQPVQENKIRLIHHGGANHSRKLELMIEMMDYLDERFTLDMMLITPPIANSKTKNYMDELNSIIKDHDRIKILPPKKPGEIVPFINQYDIGVFLLPPINFNYENTLPNKLFDFIQARLAIAIGPTPEMAKIVNENNLGVVSDQFTPQSLALKLNQLKPDDIKVFKHNSEKVAHQLNAEQNEKIMLNLVNQLIP